MAGSSQAHMVKRFVILEHTYRGVHWDFMLECDAELRTWALSEPPQPGTSIVARPLADHRLAYLDYEGPVSRERGAVKRWDRGSYTLIEQRDDCIAVRVEGERCVGTVVLTREPDGEAWRFTLDQAAGETA